MKKTFYNNKNLIIILFTALLAICAIGFIFLLPKDKKEVKAETTNLSFLRLEKGDTINDPALVFDIVLPTESDSYVRRHIQNFGYNTGYDDTHEENIQEKFFFYLSNDKANNDYLTENCKSLVIINDYCKSDTDCEGESTSSFYPHYEGPKIFNVYNINSFNPEDNSFVEQEGTGYVLKIPLKLCGGIDLSKPIYCTFGLQVSYDVKYYNTGDGIVPSNTTVKHKHYFYVFDYVSDTAMVDLDVYSLLKNHIKDYDLGEINEDNESRVESFLSPYYYLLDGSDSDYKDVVLSYSLLEQGDLSNIKQKTETYQVPYWAWINKDAVKYYLGLQGACRDIASYNVVYKSYHQDTNGDFVLEENRIRLEAKEFVYTDFGQLSVKYNDFEYKDFFIRIQDNGLDSSDFVDIYASDVSTYKNDTSKYIMTFDIMDIEEMLYQRKAWIIDMKEEDFSITFSSNNIQYVFNYKDDSLSSLSFIFPKEAESELLNGEALVVVEIVEDKILSFKFNYKKAHLDENSDVYFTNHTYECGTIGYIESKKMNNIKFEKLYLSFIEEQVRIDGMDVDFATYKTIERYSSYEAGFFVINVVYEYKTLFKITNNYNDDVVYKNLLNTFSYKGSFFVDFVPKNWRVKNIVVDYEQFEEEKPQNKEDEYDYTKYKYSVKTDFVSDDETIILPVYIEYTDSFPIRFVYMSQYNDTPFAVKKTIETEIKLIDYDIEHPKDLTLEQVANIVGVPTFEFLGVRVEEASIKVTDFTQGTYVYDLSTMTKKSVKQVASDGYTLGMLDVPLCTYSSWTNQFGQDWNCLALNTEENTYFKYSDEVAPSDLYGFFTMAVFEEKVTNLNSWFSGLGTVGCFVGFKAREVKGSEVYQFFDRMTDGILFGIGYLGMAFCELFNSDNAIYYSYFFYIDGTSALNGIGHNKMDSYDDNSSSIDNTIEDVGDAISDAFGAVKDWFNNSTFGKVVKWFLIGIAGLLALWLVVKIIGLIRKAF